MSLYSHIQGKLQKHQAFEAEVVANKDRIFSSISMGRGRWFVMMVMIKGAWVVVGVKKFDGVHRNWGFVNPGSNPGIKNIICRATISPLCVALAFMQTFLSSCVAEIVPPSQCAAFPSTALIDNNECMNHEAEVSDYTDSLKEQWDLLLEKIEEKTQKLREANQQQQFNEAVNDMDFWLGEVHFMRFPPLK
jgi:hypothetical protein